MKRRIPAIPFHPAVLHHARLSTARPRAGLLASMGMIDTRSDAALAYRAWYKTTRWQRIRASQLRAEPLCVMCAKQCKVTAATVCDHVELHKGDPVRFWTGPFQSLCKAHHDSAKQQIETRGYSSEVGADGYPVDPNHPANR